MNILATGGAGFIGSNFIRMIIDNYSKHSIINIDKLAYVENLENLRNIDNINCKEKCITGDYLKYCEENYGSK